MQLVHFVRVFIGWLGVLALVGAVLAPPTAFADAFSTWTAGPGGAGDDSYDGFIDAPTMNATVPTGGFSVTGWFVDKTAQGWAGADDVQVWQGTMDGGGQMLAKASFAQNRPDVASVMGNPYWAASGFGVVVPGASLAPGSQALSVYVHTPGKGWWYKQVQVNVSSDITAAVPAPAAAAPTVTGGALPIVAFVRPNDGEQVLTKSDYEIQGYALDLNAGPNQGTQGTGIDRVQVYLGNERENGGTLLGDADLGFSDATATDLYGPQFAASGWRLTFKPTKFKANTYLLFAYARSLVTGKEDVATRFFAIKEG
jgi:hypothetical protein